MRTRRLISTCSFPSCLIVSHRSKRDSALICRGRGCFIRGTRAHEYLPISRIVLWKLVSLPVKRYLTLERQTGCHVPVNFVVITFNNQHFWYVFFTRYDKYSAIQLQQNQTVNINNRKVISNTVNIGFEKYYLWLRNSYSPYILLKNTFSVRFTKKKP